MPVAKPDRRGVGQNSAVIEAAPTRTLLLMRHGAAAGSSGLPDRQRPLTEHGRREAALAGSWIGRHPPVPDLILCSTAARTRQTAAATGLHAPIGHLERIYGAIADELLDVLRDIDPRDRTVLLIGHAPGLPRLVAELAGSGSDPGALDRLRTGFPTATLAVLAITGEWCGIGPGRGTLLDVVVAR